MDDAYREQRRQKLRDWSQRHDRVRRVSATGTRGEFDELVNESYRLALESLVAEDDAADSGAGQRHKLGVDSADDETRG